MTTHEHEILTKQQLAELLQVPFRTVEGWRSRGVPGTDPRRNALRGVEIGGAIRYSRKAVLDYIHAAATLIAAYICAAVILGVTVGAVAATSCACLASSTFRSIAASTSSSIANRPSLEARRRSLVPMALRPARGSWRSIA